MLPSSQPTDSLVEVRKLIQERAASLVSELVSRSREAPTHSTPVMTTPSPLLSQNRSMSGILSPPASRFEALLSTYAAEGTVRSQEKRCGFCRSADHLEEDCEEANKYICTGMCRHNVFGKLVLPSGALIPRNVKGGTLRDRLEEYYRQDYRPKAAQASVSEIATRRQPEVTVTTTETSGPALPLHSKIVKKAIEPPDDYQLPQTTILHDPASRVAPVSFADTVSGPVSKSPASVCNIADSRTEASASHSVSLVPSSVPPCVTISPSVSLSSGPDPSRNPSYVSPSVLGSVTASPSVNDSINFGPSTMRFGGPELPHWQLQVTHTIRSRPRWPQNHVIAPRRST
ncbi:hypothetical protein EDB83DRAFT_2520408 [Lactarius deliciosus]|nr:hypothetical protein EDB83DRAFT_2520408 [Lactarius deliciosus]